MSVISSTGRYRNVCVIPSASWYAPVVHTIPMPLRSESSARNSTSRPRSIGHGSTNVPTPIGERLHLIDRTRHHLAAVEARRLGVEVPPGERNQHMLVNERPTKLGGIR